MLFFAEREKGAYGDEMINYMQIFIYISSGFIGLAGIIILRILIKNKNAGNIILHKTATKFVLSSMAIGIIYFFSSFQTVILYDFERNAIMRILDIVGFIAVAFYWIRLMIIISGSDFSKMQRSFHIIIAILLCASVIIYGFFADSSYYVPNDNARICAYIIEIILNLYAFGVIWIVLKRGLFLLINSQDRRFICLNSFLIIAITLSNSTTALALFGGYITLASWNVDFIDPTAILLVMINLVTLLYMYEKDFSAMYVAKESVDTTDNTIEYIINIMAEKHMLTAREREVMLMAYNGYTNPDIADSLFLSKYTVKNHMHSIFEKLNVSSRIELIHLINMQNRPGGLL
jgi:DNA-binding CsgD family transcriptional regulator